MLKFALESRVFKGYLILALHIFMDSLFDFKGFFIRESELFAEIRSRKQSFQRLPDFGFTHFHGFTFCNNSARYLSFRV